MADADEPVGRDVLVLLPHPPVHARGLPGQGVARLPRALVVEHQADAPAGLVGEWARERGVELQVLRPAGGDPWPAVGAHDAVVALGSDCSVARSPDPWIAAEVAFLRESHGAGVPVLGLCFGGQTLAAALGAAVRRAPHPEIGWVQLDRPIAVGAGARGAAQGGAAVDGPATAAAGSSADGRGVPGPFFAWHEDAFTVPPGATELARSPAGPQAVALGRSLALQFHPEVDAAIVDAWLDWGRSQLADARLDEDELRAETAARAGDARRRAFALFDGWAASWLPAAQSRARPVA